MTEKDRPDYSEYTDWQMMGLIGTRSKLSEAEQTELDREIERRGYGPETVQHMKREHDRIVGTLTTIWKALWPVLAVAALIILGYHVHAALIRHTSLTGDAALFTATGIVGAVVVAVMYGCKAVRQSMKK